MGNAWNTAVAEVTPAMGVDGSVAKAPYVAGKDIGMHTSFSTAPVTAPTKASVKSVRKMRR